MKVIDHAGNSIKVGRLLRWQHRPDSSGPLDFYVKVVDVAAPTTETPGKLEFTVIIGIPPQTKKDAQVVQFRDFITVFDPEEEVKAEAVMDKVVEMAKGAH